MLVTLGLFGTRIKTTTPVAGSAQRVTEPEAVLA
jgi:hypothetical protein